MSEPTTVEHRDKEYAMNGSERIAAERKRQVEQEGYTPEHDAEHHADGKEMLAAARCYMQVSWLAGYFIEHYREPDYSDAQRRGMFYERVHESGFHRDWPWEPEAWKPSDDPIRNLEKAGALIAAEIDRLLR